MLLGINSLLWFSHRVNCDNVTESFIDFLLNISHPNKVIFQHLNCIWVKTFTGPFQNLHFSLSFRDGVAAVFWTVVLLHKPSVPELICQNWWLVIQLQDILVESRIYGSVITSCPGPQTILPESIKLPPLSIVVVLVFLFFFFRNVLK